MDHNKKYKSEVFHRNSFSDEQKKEKRKLYIFIILVILFFAFVFIRAAYLNKIEFEEKIEGILVKKNLQSRNDFRIKVYNATTKTSSHYYYDNKQDEDNIPPYEKIEIGDSVFKDFNSHIVNVYRKKNGTYTFFYSFSIDR